MLPKQFRIVYFGSMYQFVPCNLQAIEGYSVTLGDG